MSLKNNWKKGENLTAQFVSEMATAVNGLTLLGYDSGNTGQLTNAVPAVCLTGGGSGRGALYTLDLEPTLAPPPGIVAVKSISATENSVYVIVVESIPTSEVFSGWVRIAQPGIVYDIKCTSSIEIGDYAKPQSGSDQLHISLTRETSIFTCVGARDATTGIAKFLMNMPTSTEVPEGMVKTYNLSIDEGVPTSGSVTILANDGWTSAISPTWQWNDSPATVEASLATLRNVDDTGTGIILVEGGDLPFNVIKIQVTSNIRMQITSQSFVRETHSLTPRAILPFCFEPTL